MNALTVIEAAAVPAMSAPLAEAMAAADGFAAAAEAPNTRKAYISDFKAFRAWCDEKRLNSMPAQPEVVCAYISARAQAGVKPSSIQRAVAAIRYAHKLAGHEPPTNMEAVKRVMRGIRRTVGAAPVKKAAATADIVGGMLNACPDTLGGKRDRALLCLGFAGAFRRSELVALNVEDLKFGLDGIRVTIRRSKTDQEGVGREILIAQGSRIRPVEAVREWLAAAGITEGPVFRPVNKWGTVVPEALAGQTVRLIVKRYADQIGAPGDFAAHSLRSGFITSAFEAGARIDKIKEVSRHVSTDVLLGYARSAGLAKDHAGASFL